MRRLTLIALLLAATLAGLGSTAGAVPLTRQQIHIEANNWFQSDFNSGVIARYGETIWAPRGRRQGNWWGLQTNGHDAVATGVACRAFRQMVAATFRPGTYYHATSTASGHFGLTTLNGFAAGNTGGFRVASVQVGAGDNIVFSGIPAATKRFYVFGYPLAGYDTAAAVTVANGTRVKATIDCTATGDWAGIVNTQYGMMSKALLVATDFTAEGSVTITKSAAGTTVRIIGAVAVQDGESDPANGVLDPPTCELLSYDANISFGPIKIRAVANPTSPAADALGATSRWMGIGHWTATYGGATNAGNLLSEAETLTYGGGNAWSPVDDEWTEQTSTSFRRVLKGTIATAASDNQANLGTYIGTFTITPAGLNISEVYQWGANAATEDIRVSSGGYASKWALPAGWSDIRVLPADNRFVRYAPAGANAALATYAADTWTAVKGGLVLLSTSGSNMAGGSVLVWDYPYTAPLPDVLAIYHTYNDGDEHDVAAGDVSFCQQFRVITDRGGLEPATARRRVR